MFLCRVDTKEPFFGLIHTTLDPSEPGATSSYHSYSAPIHAPTDSAPTPGCSEIGRGGLKTFLTLDLTVADRCGMTFNKVDNQELLSTNRSEMTAIAPLTLPRRAAREVWAWRSGPTLPWLCWRTGCMYCLVAGLASRC